MDFYSVARALKVLPNACVFLVPVPFSQIKGLEEQVVDSLEMDRSVALCTKHFLLVD